MQATYLRKMIEEEDEFISVKDEVKLENKIKVVDHIDLNPAHKVKPAEQTANTQSPVTAPGSPSGRRRAAGSRKGRNSGYRTGSC